MVLVSEECCRILKCNMKNLREFLKHPDNKNKVEKALIGRNVRTTYKDWNDMHKTFLIDSITTEGADQLPAYGRMRRPFNICIAAYFYCHHEIKLQHPFHQCIVERFPKGEDRYYPMELLEIVEGVPKTPVWFNDLLFTQIRSDKDEDSDCDTLEGSPLFFMNSDDKKANKGRAECSQW